MKALQTLRFPLIELLLMAGLTGLTSAQGIETKTPKVILQDTFEAAPSASPAAWTGTTSHFRQVRTAQGGMLSLSGNTERADTSWMAAPAHVSHGEWNYIIDLKLEPTQSNRIDLVLMSDTSHLKAPFSGYLIKAGDNGSADVLRLMRVDQGKMTPILSGSLSIAQGGMYAIKVIRIPGGEWQVFAAKRGEALQVQGTVRDTTYYRTGYSGFRMIYTKSNATSFGLGPLQVLRFHPEILHVSTPSPNLQRYTFDTALDTRMVPEVHLSVPLNDSLTASRIRWLTPYQLEASFDRAIARGRVEIRIHPVNSQDQLHSQLTLQSWWEGISGIKPGDLLINEYLFNPPEGVPQFVEIYNASNHPLNLKDLELLDASTGSRNLSPTTLWLPPDSLLVITPDSVSLSAYYGIKRAHYMSRFPYLNRSSPDVIKLRDPTGRLLDSLYYKPLANSYGRSVERISTTTRSTVSANWKHSEHEKGASPGQKNTVKQPTTPARVESFKLFRNRKLHVWFDREMDTLQTASLSFRPNPPGYQSVWSEDRILSVTFKYALAVNTDYRVDLSEFRDALGFSVADTTLEIKPSPDEQTRLTWVGYRKDGEWDLAFNFPVFAHALGMLYLEEKATVLENTPLGNTGQNGSVMQAVPIAQCSQRAATAIRCRVKDPLVLKPDQEYELMVRSYLDAEGYPIVEDPVVVARDFEKGDVLINEILTQPLQQRYGAPADQSQFIELYNTRGHTISMDTVRLVTGSGKLGTPTTLLLNNPEKRIAAQGFMVLLPDTISLPDSRLIRFFGQKAGSVYVMTERSTLSMPSEEGFVKLHSGSHSPEIIDSLYYRPSMHQPSLRDKRGISLERLSVIMPTTMLSNWNSFGGILGASPGEKNSNTLVLGTAPEPSMLTVSPKVFSPDSDGREDVVSIRIQSDASGRHAHLQIFDRQGRHVQTLLNGQTLGSMTTLAWNGLNKGGHKIPTGIYVVTLSMWDPVSGRREHAKAAVGLIHQGLAKPTFN